MTHFILLLVHLLSVGLLLGALLANLAVIQSGNDDLQARLAVAEAQARMGLRVFLPALVLVLLMGGGMIADAPREGIFYVKLAIGTSALIVGVWFLFLTLRIGQYLQLGDDAAALAAQTRLKWVGSGMLVLILFTIILAARYFVG